MKRNAQKSIEILNAYAGTLREIDMSDNDAPLCAALQGFLLANAAELMRHTYPSVSDTDVKSGRICSVTYLFRY